jgi:hypothetical protein
MKPLILIRMVAASLVGVLSAVFVAHDYEKWRALGREAFLAEQAHRFDARIASQSSSHLVILVLEAVLIIGLYEGVVVLITKLTSRSHPQ